MGVWYQVFGIRSMAPIPFDSLKLAQGYFYYGKNKKSPWVWYKPHRRRRSSTDNCVSPTEFGNVSFAADSAALPGIGPSEQHPYRTDGKIPDSA
jgi:hypothetical protein